MDDQPNDNLAELIYLLGGAAMYNDKGYMWTGDTPEKSEALREGWQKHIDDYLSHMDLSTIPAELEAALRDGRAARDGGGTYCDMAKQWKRNLEQR
ncbi:MAG: hypothetical protein GAK28_01416 [Luteibacter sp.]|uniref:hypothetical protein n=1 Tax=Luteibacter sp. TaxID=1886636 RepID=UPI0013831DAB|nr:hypothetical protein [Luteibacter sp.]KAF1007940.1 MAG: hypothetical protein GAK28_01416 [Luteibacter sp.]